jgi:ATP-dependent Clp protease ATP-binding subunit ClpC
MFERYTENARRVVFFARKEASDLGDVEIKAIHMLWGLLREGKAVFFRLQLPEGKLEALRTACVKEGLGGKPIPLSVDMALDEEVKAILARSLEEATSRKHHNIDVGHLLLGLLHVPNKAKDILGKNGISYVQVSALLRDNPPLGDALDYT